MPKYIDNWKQNDSCPFLGGTTRSFLQKLVFEISWGFHVAFSSDIIFSLSASLLVKFQPVEGSLVFFSDPFWPETNSLKICSLEV